jgi:hypothetical protein
MQQGGSAQSLLKKLWISVEVNSVKSSIDH